MENRKPPEKNVHTKESFKHYTKIRISGSKIFKNNWNSLKGPIKFSSYDFDNGVFFDLNQKFKMWENTRRC